MTSVDIAKKLEELDTDENILEYVKQNNESLSIWINRLINDEILTFRVSKCEFHPGVEAYRCVSISCSDDEPYEFLLETGIIEYIDLYEDEDGTVYEPGELDSDEPHEYGLTLSALVEHLYDEEATTEYECITD
jgi:hypothetical protein